MRNKYNLIDCQAGKGPGYHLNLSLHSLLINSETEVKKEELSKIIHLVTTKTRTRTYNVLTFSPALFNITPNINWASIKIDVLWIMSYFCMTSLFSVCLTRAVVWQIATHVCHFLPANGILD